jgi:hypothetical protein
MLRSGTYHIYQSTVQIQLHENVSKSLRLFPVLLEMYVYLGIIYFIQIFIYFYIIFQEDIRSLSCDCLRGRSGLVVSSSFESQHD